MMPEILGFLGVLTAFILGIASAVVFGHCVGENAKDVADRRMIKIMWLGWAILFGPFVVRIYATWIAS